MKAAQKRGYTLSMRAVTGANTVRVIIGEFATRAEAEDWAQDTRDGGEFEDGEYEITEPGSEKD